MHRKTFGKDMAAIVKTVIFEPAKARPAEETKRRFHGRRGSRIAGCLVLLALLPGLSGLPQAGAQAPKPGASAGQKTKITSVELTPGVITRGASLGGRVTIPESGGSPIPFGIELRAIRAPGGLGPNLLTGAQARAQIPANAREYRFVIEDTRRFAPGVYLIHITQSGEVRDSALLRVRDATGTAGATGRTVSAQADPLVSVVYTPVTKVTYEDPDSTPGTEEDVPDEPETPLPLAPANPPLAPPRPLKGGAPFVIRPVTAAAVDADESPNLGVTTTLYKLGGGPREVIFRRRQMLQVGRTKHLWSPFFATKSGEHEIDPQEHLDTGNYVLEIKRNRVFPPISGGPRVVRVRFTVVP